MRSAPFMSAGPGNREVGRKEILLRKCRMSKEADMPRGIALALPVATRRGYVMVFIPSLFNLGDFIIAGNGWFVFVRIRFAPKISTDIRQVESDFSGAIAGLKCVHRAGSLSCELWLYSRYGTLRYFRVGSECIEEIDCYGKPLAGDGSPGPAGTAGTDTNASTGVMPPVAALPEPADPSEIFRRWLRKRNALKLKNGPEFPAGNAVPGNNPETAVPVACAKKKSAKKPVMPATGPTVPEKIPDPGEPVKPAVRKTGTKQERVTTGMTVPEKNPKEPGGPVATESGTSPAVEKGPVLSGEAASPELRVSVRDRVAITEVDGGGLR